MFQLVFVKIADCVIRSPDHDWPNRELHLVTDKTKNKNKPYTEYEPHSAHSHAVKKVKYTMCRT